MTHPGIGGQHLPTTEELDRMEPGTRLEAVIAWNRMLLADATARMPHAQDLQHAAALVRQAHEMTGNDPALLDEWGRSLSASSTHLAALVGALEKIDDVTHAVAWRGIAALLVNAIAFAGVDLVDGK